MPPSRIRRAALGAAFCALPVLGTAAPGATAEATYSGSVRFVAFGREHAIGARFGRGTVDVASGCYPPVGEHCCFGNVPRSTGGPALRDSAAGTISVTRSGAAIGTLQRLPAGEYSRLYLGGGENLAISNVYWSGGDTLGVRASGGAIVAFDGSIVAPPPVTGLSPAVSMRRRLGPGPQPSPAAPTPVRVDAPLTVSWKPAPGFTLEVTVSGLHGSTFCSVPDDAGTLEIPAGLLLYYNSGDRGTIVVTRLAKSEPQHPPSNASIVFEVSDTIVGPVIFTGTNVPHSAY
jgi:hypothetical protein